MDRTETRYVALRWPKQATWNVSVRNSNLYSSSKIYVAKRQLLLATTVTTTKTRRRRRRRRMQTANCRTVKDNRNAECVSAHTHMYIHTHTDIRIHTQIHTHKHSRAYLHTHTRTHTHTLNQRLLLAELWKRFECIQIALGNSANAFRKIVPSIVA